MSPKPLFDYLLLAIVIGIDLSSIGLVHHYVSWKTTLLLLVGTTILGIALVRRRRRGLERFIKRRYPTTLPSDIAAIVSAESFFRACLILFALFPGFLSDIFVILFCAQPFSDRYFELWIESKRKMAARQGTSVEGMLPPISCIEPDDCDASRAGDG